MLALILFYLRHLLEHTSYSFPLRKEKHTKNITLTLSHKNKILSHATTQMDQEYIVLSEVSQRNTMLSGVCGI